MRGERRDELDRRIAVEVMGEPKPEPYVPEDTPYGRPIVDRFVSVGGGWRWAWGVGWQPLPFSTNLERAMSAVHKLLGEEDADFIATYDADRPERWWVIRGSCVGKGRALSQAICYWLLALSEEE